MSALVLDLCNVCTNYKPFPIVEQGGRYFPPKRKLRYVYLRFHFFSKKCVYTLELEKLEKGYIIKYTQVTLLPISLFFKGS